MDFIARYKDIKAEHPGAMLLFRVGDFYELYFEDAEQASKVLGLTLTTRGKNTDAPVSMAGFPHHQLEAYLQKLIATGFRAAICDQVEDPTNPKGMVKRETTKVVKTKKPKWRPNTVCKVSFFTPGPCPRSPGEYEDDIALAQSVIGEDTLVITEDPDKPKTFNITHSLTGMALLRTTLKFEDVHYRLTRFWDRLQDSSKDTFRTQTDPEVIQQRIPAGLIQALRTGTGL